MIAGLSYVSACIRVTNTFDRITVVLFSVHRRKDPITKRWFSDIFEKWWRTFPNLERFESEGLKIPDRKKFPSIKSYTRSRVHTWFGACLDRRHDIGAYLDRRPLVDATAVAAGAAAAAVLPAPTHNQIGAVETLAICDVAAVTTDAVITPEETPEVTSSSADLLEDAVAEKVTVAATAIIGVNDTDAAGEPAMTLVST